jgi:hypothetical protein
MSESPANEEGAGMERVGLIILSIVSATLLLVGASYGASWVLPYILNIIATPWPVIGFVTLFPAAVVLARRRAAK